MTRHLCALLLTATLVTLGCKPKASSELGHDDTTIAAGTKRAGEVAPTSSTDTAANTSAEAHAGDGAKPDGANAASNPADSYPAIPDDDALNPTRTRDPHWVAVTRDPIEAQLFGGPKPEVLTWKDDTLVINGGDRTADLTLELDGATMDAVWVGDLLDPQGARGARLDEIAVVDTTGATWVWAWDWTHEGFRPAIILDAVGPDASCTALDPTRVWDILPLPGNAGPTALAIGSPPLQLRRDGTRWCVAAEATGQDLAKQPPTTSDDDVYARHWRFDLDGDGKDDDVFADPEMFRYTLASGGSQRFEAGDFRTTYDPEEDLFELVGWPTDDSHTVMVRWDFENDPAGGSVGAGADVVIGISSAAGTVWHRAESEWSYFPCEDEDDNRLDRRAIEPWRLGDTALLVEQQQQLRWGSLSDTCSVLHPDVRLAREWIPFDVGGPLAVDTNRQEWSVEDFDAAKAIIEQ